MDSPLLRSWRPWAIPAVAMAGALALMVGRWGYAMDDPWITYRYGRNLARGLGLVFNPGERLEGYSNFIMVLGSAVLERLRLEPFGFVRLGGIVSLLAAIWVLSIGERRIVAGERAASEAPSYVRYLFPGAVASGGVWAFAGAIYLGLSPQAATWAVSGMETPYYLLMGLATWLCAARTWATATWRGGPRWGLGVGTGLLAFVSALMRVDGFIVAGGLVFFIGWEGLRGRRPRFRGPVLLAGTIFALLYVAYTAWRVSYFGDLIPNTAAAKATGPLGERLRQGGEYLLEWFWRGGGIGLLAAFWATGGMYRRWGRMRRGVEPARQNTAEGRGPDSRTDTPPPTAHLTIGEGECLVRLAFWMVVAQSALTVFVGGDWMPASRFVVPVVGLLGVLIGVGLRGWRRRGAWGWMIAWGTAAWIVIAVIRGDRSDETLQWCLRAARQHELLQPLKEIGEYVGAVAPPGSWIAANEAGLIAYYSDLSFLDMRGLVDRHIASLPGGLHEKFDAEYVLERKPRYVALGVTREKDAEGWPVHAVWPADIELIRAPGFRREYAPVRSWDRPLPWLDQPALMTLFERRGAAGSIP